MSATGDFAPCQADGIQYLDTVTLMTEVPAWLQAPRKNVVDAIQKKDPTAVADGLDRGYKSEWGCHIYATQGVAWLPVAFLAYRVCLLFKSARRVTEFACSLRTVGPSLSSVLQRPAWHAWATHHCGYSFFTT